MPPLLTSLFHPGLRSTLRLLLHSSTSIRKHASPHPAPYARIRQRDKKGRITATHVYRLVHTRDGEKVYRLVDWGEGGKGVREEVVVRVGSGSEGGRKEGDLERGERGERKKRNVREEGEEERLMREGLGGSTSRERGRHTSRQGASRSRRSFRRVEDVQNSDEEGVDRREGVKSPFRQPDMDVRRSHAFVFGEPGGDGVQGGELRADSRSNARDVASVIATGSPRRRERSVRHGEVVVEKKSVAVRTVAIAMP